MTAGTTMTTAGEGPDGAAAEAGGGDGAAALVAAAAVARRTAKDVPSPCVSVCRIDAARGLCTGCLRTLDEIAAWSRMADAGKRRVWRAIAARAVSAPLPAPP